MKRIDEILGQTFPRAVESEAAADVPVEEVPLLTDEKDVCPCCGGAGFVRKRVPLGHPDFGRAFPCDCTTHERDEDRRQRLLRYSNLGPLTRLTFDNLSRRGRSSNVRDQERFQRCADDAFAFAADPSGWLVLSGPSGCGKTHLGAAIANRCLELGHAALFVVVPDLLDKLRAAYHPESEVGFDSTFELVRNAPVLVLDDLGAQSTTEWAKEKLFQIINHRYNARLPTVVTTNIPIAKLDDRLNTRLSDPSLSRTFELESATRSKSRQRTLDILDQPRFQSMTFETFDNQGLHLPGSERRKLEDAYRHALDFAQNPEGWLMLVGPHGSGKTHLAVAITHYRRHTGDPPYLIEVSELLSFLRTDKESRDRSFRSEVQEIKDAPLLVLDDLDLRRGNPWWEDLYGILKYRYTRRLPTVITTFHSLSNLSLDELGERIASLLGDPAVCSEVPLPGPLTLPRSAPPESAPKRQRRTSRQDSGS